MVDIADIAQAVAVVSACWAIISGVGAWKREFIGKRQIELAEQLLSKCFEVRDARSHPFVVQSGAQEKARVGSVTAR